MLVLMLLVRHFLPENQLCSCRLPWINKVKLKVFKPKFLSSLSSSDTVVGRRNIDLPCGGLVQEGLGGVGVCGGGVFGPPANKKIRVRQIHSQGPMNFE